jgi:hypothetical protein
MEAQNGYRFASIRIWLPIRRVWPARRSQPEVSHVSLLEYRNGMSHGDEPEE